MIVDDKMVFLSLFVTRNLSTSRWNGSINPLGFVRGLLWQEGKHTRKSTFSTQSSLHVSCHYMNTGEHSAALQINSREEMRVIHGLDTNILCQEYEEAYCDHDTRYNEEEVLPFLFERLDALALNNQNYDF